MKTYRLGQVARSLNVGLSKVTDILEKLGYKVDANPNYKITEEQLDALASELTIDLVNGYFSFKTGLSSGSDFQLRNKSLLKGMDWYTLALLEEYLLKKPDVLEKTKKQDFTYSYIKSRILYEVKKKIPLSYSIVNYKELLGDIIQPRLFYSYTFGSEEAGVAISI